MNKQRIIVALLVLITLAGLWMFWVWFALGNDAATNDTSNQESTNTQETIDQDEQDASSVEGLADYTSEKGVVLRLENPKHGQTITSPLTVSGEVPGNWSFEADFPVVLTDSEGNELARGIATLQGDWMTTDYVPFEAELSFTKPTDTDTGFLVLEKDNPSGLSENDDKLELQIRF